MENGTQPVALTSSIFGLPPGVTQDGVKARKEALISAGTHPLIAEQLAISAEHQQALRDAHVENQVILPSPEENEQ